MRKKKEFQSGGPSWLDTYADMVTLLLTFFVLLYSMTTMSESKWKMLVSAFQNLRGDTNQTTMVSSADLTGLQNFSSEDASSTGEAGNEDSGTNVVSEVTNFDDLYYYFRQYVQQNNLQASVQVYKGDNYTFLSFQNSIFFDGDSAIIRDDGKQILDFFSDAVGRIPDQIGEIRFYGHTAKVTENESAAQLAYDRDLSDDRAKNVLLYVQNKGVINGDKMVSAGYGEYRPIVQDDGTEATRAKNRRVEIFIGKAGQTQDELSEIYSEIYDSSVSS